MNVSRIAQLYAEHNERKRRQPARMSVLLQTSVGELVIDLLTKECPIATKNFLKCMLQICLWKVLVSYLSSHSVCKIKYYNNCLFYDVQKDFIVQTGDPTNTGRGGESLYGYVIVIISNTQSRTIHTTHNTHILTTHNYSFPPMLLSTLFFLVYCMVRMQNFLKMSFTCK